MSSADPSLPPSDADQGPDAPPSTPSPASPPPSSQPETPTVTAAECKQALKAFKKRLKLSQLDDESRLGGGPLTGGGKGLTAVAPPDRFGQAVWDELVRQGRLKSAGHGLYELVRH